MNVLRHDVLGSPLPAKKRSQIFPRRQLRLRSRAERTYTSAHAVVRVDARVTLFARFSSTLGADSQLCLARPLASRATAAAFRRTGFHRSTIANFSQVTGAAVQNGQQGVGKMGRKVVLTLHRNDLRCVRTLLFFAASLGQAVALRPLFCFVHTWEVS